jgi:diguanylate cyclase (GGDEF)-like protein
VDGRGLVHRVRDLAATAAARHRIRSLFDARRQAVTDELTGLGNRRYLFEHGQERLLAAADDRLALVLIDLDNFKEINDTFGHHGGDELLRESARRLATRMVDPDLLVRLGGDEFALLITLGPNEHAPNTAARILDRLTQPP